MKKQIKKYNCVICGKLFPLDEMEVNYSKELYCKSCWDEWEMEREA